MFTCDVIKRTLCTQYVGNVIYLKFCHCDVPYRVNGENVNVMLEYNLMPFVQMKQTMAP